MQRHYIGASTGVFEVTDRVPRVGWELTEKAEEGSYGSGTQTFDDPLMDFDPEPLRTYYVVEDESEDTDDVIFWGYLAGQAVGRIAGDRRQPLKRAWSIAVVDANSYWTRRVMVGTDNKRNAENDTTRMAWLLTTSEASFIDDAASYVSSASATAMDKNDYRGQLLSQIIGDASLQSGKNWWLKGIQTGSGHSRIAWYGDDSLTAYSSPLFLSNDLSDMLRSEVDDGTSLVYPISKADRLERDPDRLYTGVYLRYDNGRKAIYRRNPDVSDPLSPIYGLVRDFVSDHPNVRTKAKANARALRILADIANPNEVISATVELPKGKASMLKAGMRVQFKATHMPGYEDWRWLRVLSCTISPIASGQRYHLALELQGPGTEGTAAPYAGDAFAAVLRSTGSYGVGPYFQYEGDVPPGGWFEEPSIGPLSVVEASAPFFSIVTSEPIVVRIELVVQASWVAADGDYITVAPTINGTPIGPSDTATNVGGGFYGPSVGVDIHNVLLAAGDVVSYQLTDSEGYPILNSGGTNSTYLRVGRGTISMNSGAYVWVGP